MFLITFPCRDYRNGRFLDTSQNTPLCAVMTTSLRETLPGPCVHIVKHKHSEKEPVCSDKTCFAVRGNCVWSNNRYSKPFPSPTDGFRHFWIYFTFYMTQVKGDFSPESAANLTLHSEHLSRASRRWGVTETAENHMPQSRAKKFTIVPEKETQPSGDDGPTSANFGVPTRTSLSVTISSSLVMPWGSLGGWRRWWGTKN